MAQYISGKDFAGPLTSASFSPFWHYLLALILHIGVLLIFLFCFSFFSLIPSNFITLILGSFVLWLLECFDGKGHKSQYLLCQIIMKASMLSGG